MQLLGLSSSQIWTRFENEPWAIFCVFMSQFWLQRAWRVCCRPSNQHQKNMLLGIEPMETPGFNTSDRPRNPPPRFNIRKGGGSAGPLTESQSVKKKLYFSTKKIFPICLLVLSRVYVRVQDKEPIKGAYRTI